MNKITKKDQRISADILTQFMFTGNMDDVKEVWGEVFKQYGLHEDPFTHTPCTNEEYFENQSEYEKQLMIDKYGHCDGLE